MNTNIKARPVIVMQSVTSSQISAIGHDPETGTLAIQFTSKSGIGSTYHYQNVTVDQFAAFRDAESVGSHFYKHIKPFPDVFAYEKIPTVIESPAPAPAALSVPEAVEGIDPMSQPAQANESLSPA
jgi:hypothetical protein